MRAYTRQARRKIAHLSIIGTTQLHLKSAYVVVFWSFMFPGLGHLLMCKYLRGYILFLWEIFVNVKAHVNLGIYYSLIGKFDEAKACLDTRWLLLYLPTFIFAVWDSYRTAISLNENYILAARENSKVKHLTMNSVEINYLDKSSPTVVFFWSMLMPGLGQLQQHQILLAFFYLFWWIVVMYMSRFLPALQYTFLGRFDLARSVLDPQWTLNISSLLLFAGYDAYVSTVEANKLFDLEQDQFLKQNYQSPLFPYPI